MIRNKILKESETIDTNYQKLPESWNTLECLKHLDLYGRFYIPEIDKRINSSKTIRKVGFWEIISQKYASKETK